MFSSYCPKFYCLIWLTMYLKKKILPFVMWFLKPLIIKHTVKWKTVIISFIPSLRIFYYSNAWFFFIIIIILDQYFYTVVQGSESYFYCFHLRYLRTFQTFYIYNSCTGTGKRMWFNFSFASSLSVPPRKHKGTVICYPLLSYAILLFL